MTSKRATPNEIDAVVSSLQCRQGLVIVLSAPSGTGKTTVCERLLGEMPEVRRSVSFTTRPRRRNEKNAEHYYFVTRRAFQEECDTGRFVEWAEVHGYLYGTPRDLLEKQIRAGEDTVLVIDVQGARAIKESFPEAVLIFLLPPSVAELQKRLKVRSSDSAEDTGLRLKNARAEFNCYPAYDYLVVNEDVDEAVKNLKAIIVAERCRASRLKPEPFRMTK